MRRSFGLWWGGHANINQTSTDLKRNGPHALSSYMRNVRLSLYAQADDVILEVER